MRASRLVAFAFGASFALLTAAWTRGVGHALGGDGLAAHLALGTFLLPVAWGAAARGFAPRWGLRYAGAVGILVAYLAPEFEREASAIYHALGAGPAGATASVGLGLLLALLPGAGAGRAIAILLERSKADPIAPALAGAAAGLAAVDLVPFGTGWGELLLAVAGIGVVLPIRASKEEEEGRADAVLPRSHPRRAGLASCVATCAAAASFAAAPLLEYAAQFHPGRRFDHTAVLGSLLLCGFVGAVAFGGLLEGKHRLPAALGFAALAGPAAALSLSLAGRLAQPDFFQGYAGLFHRKIGARDGSFLFDAVFACGLGSLPCFAGGAALRCLFGGTRAAMAGPVAFGAGFGLLGSALFFSGALPSAGLRDGLAGGALALVAAGSVGALLATGPWWLRLAGVGVPVAMGALVGSRIPERIRIANPFNLMNVEIFQVRETLDGIAAAVAFPSGDPVARLDRASLANDGPSTRAGRSEVVVSCALAERLERVLLVGVPIPRIVALLRRAGAGRVEAAPSSLAAGRVAQFFASREEERVDALHRAPGGLAGRFDLVLVLPEPTYLAGASRSFAPGRLRALARLARPRGLLAVWAVASSMPVSAFEAVAGAAGEGDRRVVLHGLEAVSVGFLRGPSRLDLGRISSRPVYREAGLLSAEDVDALKLETAAFGPSISVLPAAGLRGCFPSFERKAPLAWRPPIDLVVELPAWTPDEGKGGPALARLAAWGSASSLGWVLRGLAAHESVQVRSVMREAPSDRIEVSAEEGSHFVEASIALPPAEPIARVVEAWGELLLRKREYGEAYARFAEIVRRAPPRPGYLRILATAHLELLDPAGALPFLDRAFELAPDDLDVVGLRARALAEGGDRSEARRFLESQEGRRPNEVRILVPLTRLLLEMGEREAARGRLEAAERIAPGDPSVVRLRGEWEQALSAPASRPN